LPTRCTCVICTIMTNVKLMSLFGWLILSGKGDVNASRNVNCHALPPQPTPLINPHSIASKFQHSFSAKAAVGSYRHQKGLTHVGRWTADYSLDVLQEYLSLLLEDFPSRPYEIRDCNTTILPFISIDRSNRIFRVVLWKLDWQWCSACLDTPFACLHASWFILAVIHEGVGAAGAITDTRHFTVH